MKITWIFGNIRKKGIRHNMRAFLWKCSLLVRKHLDKMKGLDFISREGLEKTGLSIERSEVYGIVNLKDVRKVLMAQNINNDDSIIDLGCGKGAVLVTFSKYPFKRVAGVELSKYIYDIACKNMRILGLETIELYNVDASSFIDIDDFNYIFLYNPFPSIVMKKVIANIETSIRAKPRVVTIIYFNPVCEADVLESGVFMCSPP